ncbi:MAG: AtpZ/AtpI family protein [bacterium]
MSSTNKKPDSTFRAYATYSVISVQLVVGVVLGAFVGKYLDSAWNTKPLLLIVGVLLGMAGSFYLVFKYINYFQKKNITDDTNN